MGSNCLKTELSKVKGNRIPFPKCLPWHLHLTIQYGPKFHPANVSFFLKDKENAVAPPHLPHPVNHGFIFCSFSYPWSMAVWKEAWNDPPFSVSVVTSQPSNSILPGIPNHQHCLLPTPNHWYHYGSMIQGHPKQTCLPLTYHQVNSSLMLCPNDYIICLTSCHHYRCFISHHHQKKNEYSIIRCF